MPALAGIIHPHLFHSRDFVDKMLCISRGTSISEPSVVKVDNYELGVLDGEIYQHRKNKSFSALIGNIYNFPEIKNILKQAGYPNKEYSVAEALFFLYEIQGKKFIEKVNGDFCIAIFDKDLKSFLLFRDRIGKNTLYWSCIKGYLVFSTHIKGILSTGLVPQEVSKSGLSAYLSLGYFPQDFSPVKHINKLLPGHYIKWQTSEGVSVKSYWSLSGCFTKDSGSPLSQNDLFDAFEERLNQSIICRSQGIKNSLGLVGGGLGSASLAALLSEHQTDLKLSSVSIKGVRDPDFIASLEVSKTLNLPHQSCLVSQEDLFSNLTKMVWALDEPIADSHSLFSWQLCQLASQNHSSFFSGMGAKELLGLHQRYQDTEENLNRRSNLASLLLSFKDPLLKTLSYTSKKLTFQTLQFLYRLEWENTSLFEKFLFSEKEKRKLSRNTYDHFNPYAFIMKFSKIKELGSATNSFLYFDIKTQLCDRFLVQYQNFASYFNVDWHTPFLDHRLIEFLASMPSEFKSNQPHHPSPLEHILKKRAFQKSFIQRDRVHRKNFLDNYVDQPFIQKIAKTLENGVLVESGLIHPHYLKRYVLNLPITRLSFNRLFSILCLEIWYRLFIVNRVDSPNLNKSLIDFLNE
ncbi:Uncharacterized protein AB751O23_BZ_00050 [Chlamydiales bacterium SCGC AB-751-O23]|jgi:asparagine synthase (glutamine-hydrolysing)|nr:Uncharacterized protein AB751O23_BZ_00050 [Chlamydiales bacterium SCGC AB-751-O23]